MNEESKSGCRVGVYVDIAHVYRNGGQKMRYDVLREFACRGHAEPIRLNAYASYDRKRGETDDQYRKRSMSFHSALRDLGYKVLIKPVKWFRDDAGNVYGKADADLDLAVDALLQSEKLDRVMIVSGDGDFLEVIRALQNKGCRVEVVALDNASSDLRHGADMFISGYLVPSLIPTDSSNGHEKPWGEIGSRVRGWCYWHHETESYGFIRYLKKNTEGLWITDTRNPLSPYATTFLHDSNLPPEVNSSLMPSRDHIFEFTLVEKEQGIQAANVKLISRLNPGASVYG